MSNGFVVLHRSIQEHPRYRREHCFRIFADMEMEAAHRGYKKEFDGKIIFVKPGQLITDRVSLGKKLGIEPNAVERTWAQMKKDGDVSWEARPGSKGRLFTVHGYTDRQRKENRTANSLGKLELSRTANEQRTNSERTAIIGAQQWNNENKANNDDDSKTLGSSLAQPADTTSSSSSNSDWIKEAEKDELFPQFASFAPTLTEKGWKTWRSKHSPKPKHIGASKRPGGRHGRDAGTANEGKSSQYDSVGKIEPHGWKEWRERNYPGARVLNYWKVSDDVRREFNNAQKN